MQFDDAAELEDFRIRLRLWIESNPIEQGHGETRPMFLQRWHQVLYSGGWMGLSWPAEVGGAGLTAAYEAVLNEEIGRASAPDAPRIGYLGRAILHYGSALQQQRYLRPLLSGEDFWCQGFSEPEAGSDLAALTTTAVPIDGGYRISGQKTWSSYADHADLCLLLARIGPRTDRHKNIAAFILPMDLVGIEVRPIRANTGESEFAEIFLDDVEVPIEQLLGTEGQGWAIAMMTVAYERGAVDVGYLSKFASALGTLRADLGPTRLEDPSVARDIGRADLRLAVLTCHVMRRLAERQANTVPAEEMSVDKILMTEADQILHQVAVELLGPAAIVGDETPRIFSRYLYSRAASIYGGTQQIQLNILADRVLGLPRQ